MNKSEAIATIVSTFPDLPLILTTGYISRIAFALGQRPNHFYMVGSMGLASSIGFGLAASGDRVVVVDGDGSVLMSPSGLLLATELPGCALLHVVLNDGSYASTGGQPTSLANSRISELARACGYESVHDATEGHQLASWGGDRRWTGPTLVNCHVDPGTEVGPRIDLPLRQVFRRTREWCASRQVPVVVGAGRAGSCQPQSSLEGRELNMISDVARQDGARSDEVVVKNALASYYEQIQQGMDSLLGRTKAVAGTFRPSCGLPELSDRLIDYFGASDLSFATMTADYAGARVSLLDLRRNPGTNTTKTFASLIIVARAVAHIQLTGEDITIISPSSANKGTALRDAVARAWAAGLVAPEQLNVVVLCPETSRSKLRHTEGLAGDEQSGRNPVGLLRGQPAANVKSIAQRAVDRLDEDPRTGGRRIWYTLEIENYLVADAVRALAEADHFAGRSTTPRLHAHAVSSAYGLLGHDFGRKLLGDAARARTAPSQYLLVQHPATDDMVVSLYARGGGVAGERSVRPSYVGSDDRDVEVQQMNPRFPLVRDVRDGGIVDPTFYTRSPPTAAAMNALIDGQGGGGIVVSKLECRRRYEDVGALLAMAGISLAADPNHVREWSLNMAMTGVLNSLDRGLTDAADILVHGSGYYAIEDFESIRSIDIRMVDDVESFEQVVRDAVRR